MRRIERALLIWPVWVLAHLMTCYQRKTSTPLKTAYGRFLHARKRK